MSTFSLEQLEYMLAQVIEDAENLGFDHRNKIIHALKNLIAEHHLNVYLGVAYHNTDPEIQQELNSQLRKLFGGDI